MSVKQVSVFVEDKPGKLNEMTQVLAENNINMRAISVAATDGFGIIRLIVDDVYETTTVLKDAGYVNKLTSVVMVAMSDAPGGLNQVLNVFTDAKINIEYMYALASDKSPDKAYMIFRVDAHKDAEAALTKAGITVLHQDDVAGL